MDNNPFQIESASDVGDPIPLISSHGNHPPIAWADSTARMILDTQDITGDRLSTAMVLQDRVMLILAGFYSQVIDREIDHLNTFVDHCDSDYDVAEIAEHAVHEIRSVADGTEWAELIRGAEWSASAYLTIANHLSTAIHVERLLFADLHADNKAAMAYRSRFQPSGE